MQVRKFPLVQLPPLKLSLCSCCHHQDGPQGCMASPLHLPWLWCTVGRISLTCRPLWARDKVELYKPLNQILREKSAVLSSQPHHGPYPVCSPFILGPCFWKGGMRSGRISITCEPVRNGEPRPCLGLSDWNLRSTKIPLEFTDAINCVKPWTEAATL